MDALVEYPTLHKVLDRYKNAVSILKRGFEQESYRIRKLQQSFLAEQPISTLTSVDIATYRDQRLSEVNPKTGKPLSPSTVRLEMSLLSSVFDVARIEWGLVDENPVTRVRKPKPAPPRTRRLMPREDRIIRKYCEAYSNPELLSIYILALTTAMRQAELLGLRWERIDLKASVAHLPETKNGSSRDVPLSLEAREALMRLGPQPQGRVFTYRAAGLKSVWRAMMRELAIEDLHFHDLRHEAISRLFELGTLDVMEIATISGHKSLAMLKRYTHLRARRLVKKLDAGRKRARQQILTHFIPYPATLEVKSCGTVVVEFPDFGAKHQIIGSEDSIEYTTRALLCQLIATTLARGDQLPTPGYEETDTEPQHSSLYIDPLAA
ncbi:site-specific integrase [Billgrantia desiderata]|jgi:integrase|uniref:site-specific integrase n=1 Tax=Billgrantia desiderata TaxID=52021 RepID=UPI001F265C7D|nr:site-specific integrase [Halomonas desiderata]MCE8013924.1 site-specific integrase [Halomonas desiderata]